MRRPTSSTLGLALVLAGATTACEPAAPPVTPATVATVPADEPKPAAPVYDLSPVAEPVDVVAVVRWKNPSATIATALTCGGMPAQISSQAPAGLVALLPKILEDVPEHDRIAKLVTPDAPVDFVATLDPESKKHPHHAVSVGLSSLDEAKKIAGGGGDPVELGPGIWRLGPKVEHHMVCAVAASAGSAPARLVCAGGEKAILALAPYLTRTLAVAAPGQADLHAELHLVPVDARYGAEMRQTLNAGQPLAQAELALGEPEFDRALGDAISALADEANHFVSDADKLTFDIATDPTTCLTLSGSFTMRHQESWIAKTLLERTDRQGPAPAMFWHLPKDADSAHFGYTGDPAKFSGIMKTLHALAHGALTKEKLGSDGDRKAIADLLNVTMASDSVWVSASGHADSPHPMESTGVASLDGVVSSFAGWTLLGLENAPDSFAKTLRAALEGYDHAAFQAALRKRLKADDLPSVKVGPAPGPLGKGAMDIAITVMVPKGTSDASKGKEAPKGAKRPSATFHVFVMTEGKATWIAFGSNREELVKRLVSVKSGAPDAASLATRSGLGRLKDEKMATGGFTTINTFTKAATSAAGAAGGKGGAIIAAITNLPHKGETPSLDLMKTSRSPAQLDFTVAVPRDAVEDIGAIIAAALRDR